MQSSNRIKENIYPEKGSLKKILGVGFGIAITIGGTIGVGILRTPGMVAAQLRNSYLIMAAWVIGGVYALLGTVSVIELGAMIPKAGGWYVFVRRAFGDYAGFVIGWSDWIATSASVASFAIAIGEFSISLFPSGFLGIKEIAIISILLLTSLQWFGLKSGSLTQEITSIIKVIAFLALVFTCFYFGKHVAAVSSINGEIAKLNLPTGLFAAFVIALQSIIFTYDGWYSAIYFTEEDRDPGKNLSRSAIIGVLAIIAIYLLVNLGLLYVLPVSELGSSTAPATTAAIKMFGNNGGKIITILSIAALISILNAALLIATRIIFGLGRNKLFTTKITTVSKDGSPRFALLVSSAFVILLIASGTLEILIAVSAFFYVVNYFAGFSSLFYLRKKEPELPRPVKAWGYPWTPLIFITGSLIFLIGDVFNDPLNALLAAVFFAVSYPAFKLVRKLNSI